MRHLRNVLMLLICLGCGSETTGPVTANVAGSWSYSAGSDGGGACTASGITLRFTQSGTTLAGTFAGGTLLCNGSWS
jgi:hypothetical protein